MAKQKLKQKDFNEITKKLPPREKAKLKLEEINKEFLEAGIESAENAIKWDKIIGFPLVVFYCYLLWQTGFSNWTIGVFFITLIYFVHAVFTRGSYGENARRLKIYKQLLEKI